MTRVLSALVLLPVVIGTIWWLPPWATLILAEVAVLLAAVEYVGLAKKLGARVPGALTTVAVLSTCAAVPGRGGVVAAVLMAAVVVMGAAAVGSGRLGRDALLDVAAALFPALYLGLPAGAVAAVRFEAGPADLLVLLLTVMASDTAQYYGGRAFGRRALAPAISPGKTIEGALTGFVVGTAAFVGLGRWGLPGHPAGLLGGLGATLVALGIVGDLFESLLKRSAGVKDASGLIPGHGGMMDRIDSLLFAAPVYYLYVRYMGS